MTGVHEFKVTIQPAPENPSLSIVDVNYSHGGNVKHSSWIGEIKESQMLLDVIYEVMRIACQTNDRISHVWPHLNTENGIAFQ